MKKQTKRKIIMAGILLIMIIAGCVACTMPTYAAEQGNTKVTIKAEATMVDVTVPTTLPIVFNADGTNTVPQNFAITNNNNVADIYLEEVSMLAGDSGWRLLDKTTGAETISTDAKDIQFSLGRAGEEKPVLPKSGSVSSRGVCEFEQTDFVIPRESSKIVSFEIERAVFTQALPIAKAFDMTMSFAFVKNSYDKKTVEAGLYDESGTLLYTWDTLVDDYDLDVEASYSEYNSVGTMLCASQDFEKGYKLVVEDGITKIGKYALAGSNLTEIVLPDTVTEMGMYAFFNSVNLRSVVLGDGVNTIPVYAFGLCTSLQNISLPKTLERMESYAFRSCSSLQTISIPESVTSIDSYGDKYSTTFMNCANLTTICYGGTAAGAPWGAKNATVVSE